MKEVGGVWLPSHETHMVEWMSRSGSWVDGKLTYQWSKLKAAIGLVKQFRTAIDAGAHCGTWSMHLTKRFARVVAFEPVAEHRDCFVRNVSGNFELIACALGAKEGMVRMDVPAGSSGGTHVAGNGNVPLRRMDEFNIMDVDFLKVDVEGYEYPLLLGGERTIRRDKPVVIVEQKPKGLAERYGYQRMQAAELLEAWGAELQFEMSGDYCYAWR